jgi:hypothetical protein
MKIDCPDWAAPGGSVCHTLTPYLYVDRERFAVCPVAGMFATCIWGLNRAAYGLGF